MQPARLSSRTCLPIAVALIHTKKAPYKKLNLIECPPANPIGCITQRGRILHPMAGCLSLWQPLALPSCRRSHTALPCPAPRARHRISAMCPPAGRRFLAINTSKTSFRSCDPARFIWRPCKPACRGICPLRLALCRWQPQNTCRI